MVSNNTNNQLHSLPNDWKLQIKLKNSRKFKCYVHSKTGQKLYSRLAVLRYIKNESVANASSNGIEMHVKKSSTEQEKQLVEAYDGLPAGWTVEVKQRQSGCRKGTSYKCFIDPSEGLKFYSKPEVLRYLQSIQNSAGPSGREERRSTGYSSSNRPVDQQKAQESNVEPNLKTTASRRLSLRKKERPVDQQKAQEFDVQPNVLQDSKTSASRRLSSEKRERPVDQHKAQKADVEPNVLQNSKPTASRGLSSSANKKSPVDQKKAWESNVKPDLSRNSNTTTSRKLSSGKIKVVIENTVDEDLPSGWIKEKRKKIYGAQVRSDPFYFHPASGLVFRSKPDVLRYLKTGEISRHAYWRRNYVNKEDVSVEKSSSTTSYHKTRKELFAVVETPKVSPSLTPKTRVIEEADGRRITRSSSKVKPVSVSDAKPNQSYSEETPKRFSSLTPESRVVEEADGRRITRSSSKVKPVSVSDAKPDQSNGEETPRSSPSLTLETRVVKETGIRRVTRSSSKVRPVSSTEAKPDQSSLFSETTKMGQETTKRKTVMSTVAVSMEGSSNRKTETTKRRKTGDQTMITMPSHSSQPFGIDSQPISASEAKPDQSSLLLETTKISQETTQSKAKDQNMNKLMVNTSAVSMKGCSNKKTEITKRRKSEDQKKISIPSRSSKRLAGIDFQPLFLSIPIEHAHRAPRKKPIGDISTPSLGTITNDLQYKPEPSDDHLQNVHKPLAVSSETVLSTKEWNKSDSLMQNALPVFSENEVIVVPPISAELASENPRNYPTIEREPGPMLGSKIENSFPGCRAPAGKMSSIVTGTELSGSDFSFPPPLWSDPCLEFAYKTLTGAIPLDDNLAIEDYIQHQLRTSKPSDEFQSLPDIDMPSFLQNDEPKQVPTLPEGNKLPNGHGSTPNKTST